MGNEVEGRRNGEKNNSIAKVFYKFAFWSWQTVVSIAISIFIQFCFSWKEIFSGKIDWGVLTLKIVLTALVVALILRIPAFFLSRLQGLSDNINTKIDQNTSLLAEEQRRFNESIKDSVSENLKKIDRCPRLTAFHTENGSLKRKLDAMVNLEPNERWMMSMFISKLLSFHFGTFTVKIETLPYSQFSKEIMKESKKSVKLTGSMRPSTWLGKLVDPQSKDKRLLFFNNMLPVDGFPLDKDNHSLYLNECTGLERLRIVCLSPEDISYLFISERSVDAYFGKNAIEGGIQTFFTKWIDGKQKMRPLQYEYALYDDVLLFKFDREKEELTVINGMDDNSGNNDEFKEVVDFFSEEDKNIVRLNYLSIIEEVQKQKIRLLKDIAEYRCLPHKYSYLYSGSLHWINYMKEATKYGNQSTLAIEKILRSFLNTQNASYDVVEIGAGCGNRISTVCDAIGTERIQSYTLVDISSRLQGYAKSILEARLEKAKCKYVVLDCSRKIKAERTKVKELTDGKTVLILSNSTLFTDTHFSWDQFSTARQIILSMDLFTSKEDTYKDLIKAKKIFLQPLKIFEIPILENVIDSMSDYLFSYEYDETQYLFKIHFNLKLYLTLLKRKNNAGVGVTAEEIAEEINNNDKNSIINIINHLWQDEDYIKEPIEIHYKSDGKPKSMEYLKERELLFDMNELTVLSCLKFHKKGSDADTKESIKLFFQKLDYKVEKVKIVDEKFVGIQIKHS